MNANELADELIVASSEMEYNHIVDDWKLLSDAAKMLRQQQAEIEALNLFISERGETKQLIIWKAQEK